MKEDVFYFMIEERKKLIFGCNFEETANKWVESFETCIKHSK